MPRLNKPEQEKKKSLGQTEISLFGGRIPETDVIFSIQNLSIMLKTGLPIGEAMDVLSTQAQSKGLRDTFSKIIGDINAGLSLAESIRKYPKAFSPLVVSIVNAGEQGGSLENNLAYLADYLKRNYELKKKIRSAMFYPLVILGLTGFEFIAVVFLILPQLDTFFSTLSTKSLLTSIVLDGGRFIRSNGLILLISLILFCIGMFFFLKTLPGKYFKDYMMLHLPVFRRLNKNVILANFARTFGILLQSGIPMYNALTLASETINNRLYSGTLTEVQKKVLGGVSVSACLSSYPKYFPSMFSKMIEVGERAGALEQNLLSMHQYYSNEAEEISNNLTVLIEPILLIFIGLVVGVLAIAVIVPLYQIVASVKI